MLPYLPDWKQVGLLISLLLRSLLNNTLWFSHLPSSFSLLPGSLFNPDGPANNTYRSNNSNKSSFFIEHLLCAKNCPLQYLPHRGNRIYKPWSWFPSASRPLSRQPQIRSQETWVLIPAPPLTIYTVWARPLSSNFPRPQFIHL